MGFMDCDFTIIIPHKNIPNLLQRCLDSIPDVPDVQVIVVDDNSSVDKVDFDHFPGLERRYTECIFDKQGGGAGHARNVGMQHADGKWLVFADADDFFTSVFYDILLSHKHAPYDILLYKSNSVYSDDLSPANRMWQLNKAIDEVLDSKITDRQAVMSRYCPVCKMFRTSHIKEHGITFDETRYSNDQMFVAKATCLAEDNRVKVFDEVLYTVTVRKGSLIDGIKKDPENFLCRMEVHIRCNKFLKDYPQFRKEPMFFQLQMAWEISIKTFFKALKMLLERGALFSGFDTFLRIINNHTLKLNL